MLGPFLNTLPPILVLYIDKRTHIQIIICIAHHWTGFYMIGSSIMKELKVKFQGELFIFRAFWMTFDAHGGKFWTPWVFGGGDLLLVMVESNWIFSNHICIKALYFTFAKRWRDSLAQSLISSRHCRKKK